MHDEAADLGAPGPAEAAESDIPGPHRLRPFFRRGSVFRQWKVGSQHDNGTWFGSDRTLDDGEDFPTFAEAIAYADREARR